MGAPIPPAPWLRGPVAGVPAVLLPVAHTLQQVREEIEHVASGLSSNQLWGEPGGAASIGFHLKHVAGSTDRHFTQARGEVLSDAQIATLADEQIADRAVGADALVQRALAVIDAAIEQLRTTPESRLMERREVGRMQYPSDVLGVLYHAAAHAQRHSGQIITTARVIRGA
jgi:uncharacterized damage-inducible protein DinB